MSLNSENFENGTNGTESVFIIKINFGFVMSVIRSKITLEQPYYCILKAGNFIVSLRVL